jgi:hypothetical protein
LPFSHIPERSKGITGEVVSGEYVVWRRQAACKEERERYDKWENGAKTRVWGRKEGDDAIPKGHLLLILGFRCLFIGGGWVIRFEVSKVIVT